MSRQQASCPGESRWRGGVAPVRSRAMNVRFLESLVWVARLGSFKAAADRLCTTPAGLSSRIATLEAQLGVRLFDRDSRAATLTPDGARLLPHAERMLAVQAEMLAEAGQGGALRGTLRLGVVETVASTWLAPLIARYADQYPRVTLEVESLDTPALHERLLRGALDCVVTTEAVPHGLAENRPITRLATAWYAHPSLLARLPAHAPGFADLAALPIVAFTRESPLHRPIVRAAQEAGLAGAVRVHHFSSLGAMTALVRAGFGVALLPCAAVPAERGPEALVALDVRPAPQPLPLIASQRLDQAAPLADAMLALAPAVCAAYFAERGEARRCLADH